MFLKLFDPRSPNKKLQLLATVREQQIVFWGKVCEQFVQTACLQVSAVGLVWLVSASLSLAWLGPVQLCPAQLRSCSAQPDAAGLRLSLAQLGLARLGSARYSESFALRL